MKCEYDLKALALAARDMGFVVSENDYPYLYGTQRKCDLVIQSRQHRYSYGFVKNEKGQMEMVYDGDADHMIKKEMAEKILPRYMERMLEQNAHGRLRVHQRTEVGRMVELRVREA
jgi:hypothetical protein